jgi:DNA-binding transcriptional ArsR family regulator
MAFHANTSADDVAMLAAGLHALAHPTRIRALVAIRESERSPVELAGLFRDPEVALGAIAYHVRLMARAGLIELSQTIRRRGAIEHRYTITERGRAMERMVKKLAAQTGGSSSSRDS